MSHLSHLASIILILFFLFLFYHLLQGEVCSGEAVCGKGHRESLRCKVHQEAATRSRLQGGGRSWDCRLRGSEEQPSCGEPACCIWDRSRSRSNAGIVSAVIRCISFMSLFTKWLLGSVLRITLNVCVSAAGGEIFDHCVSEELLPEGQITRLIRQMLEGVHLLHQSSVVHLDLKVRCF